MSEPYVLLRSMAEIFNRPPLSEEAAKTYFVATGFDDPKSAAAAIRTWLSSEGVFPAPCDLREQAAAAEGGA